MGQCLPRQKRTFVGVEGELTRVSAESIVKTSFAHKPRASISLAEVIAPEALLAEC